MKLGVNVDHIATLRQARGGKTPDAVAAAQTALKVGADSIVMHLREDRRHIQDADIFLAQEKIPACLNLEMAAVPSIVKIALRLRPSQVTLVPEKRRERTTESGLNLINNWKPLLHPIQSFKKKHIRVSLFIDPEPNVIKLAGRLGADAVEFHTGPYSDARTLASQNKELKKIQEGTELGHRLGLLCHAGHGLDYKNVAAVCKINGLTELNIGYSIVCRALEVGWVSAVREMKALVA